VFAARHVVAVALVFMAVHGTSVHAQTADGPSDSIHAEAWIGGGYTLSEPAFYDIAGMRFSFDAPFLSLVASAHLSNDGKFLPTEAWLRDLGNQYIVIDQGTTGIHAGNFSFLAGYMKPTSSIDTPYQVYLNPNAPASLSMVLSFEDSFFEYESRWISVNLRSANKYGWGPASKEDSYWLDKSVNYRLLAVKLGDVRVGYEESSVYLRSFDANYFFSPLPSFLTNTIMTQSLNPWTQDPGYNDNTLMGAFADYRSGPAYGEAQLLVDGVNFNFLVPAGSSLNTWSLNQLAWSLGGRYAFPFGTLGLWHGGATAYTYAAIYPTQYSSSQSAPYDANKIPYEYMYIPTVVYNGSIVDVRDSNIGFMWGENALAFRLTYDALPFAGTPWELSLNSSFEWAINGQKSPDNPWHAYTDFSHIPERIQLFNVGGAEVLEHVLLLRVGAAKRLGDFTASIRFDIGGDINAMTIDYGDANMMARNEAAMLTPLLGNNKLILGLELKVGYTLSMTP
jgi:hypothetical protein